jgi:fatty acid desaturase
MRNVPAATQLLNSDQLDRVRARSDLWGCYLVTHAWTVIIAAAALFVAYPTVVTYLFAVLVIGSRQLGLLILMHDAAHNALCRTPLLNRLIAQGLCAWPTLADTHVYRRYHLKHHVRTLHADDPDIVLTGHYPITRASLRRKLWRDISGQTGYAQRKAQIAHALGEQSWPLQRRLEHYWKNLGPQTVSNVILFALAAASGYAWAYIALWLVPLLTWQQLVLRVRNIAEHAVVRDADDPFGNARTTLPNPLERMFVSPYWVNYHLEHHLIMWVPCYRLPLVREFLFENGYGERIETENGYLDVLRKVSLALPGDSSGSPPRKRASGTFSDGFEAS